MSRAIHFQKLSKYIFKKFLEKKIKSSMNKGKMI